VGRSPDEAAVLLVGFAKTWWRIPGPGAALAEHRVRAPSAPDGARSGDRSFLIKNGFGGGARIAYNWKDRSLEVTGRLHPEGTNVLDRQDIHRLGTIRAEPRASYSPMERTRVTLCSAPRLTPTLVFGKKAPFDFARHLVKRWPGFAASSVATWASAGRDGFAVRKYPPGQNRYFANAFRVEVPGFVSGLPGSSFRRSRAAASNTGISSGTGARIFGWLLPLAKTNTQPYAYDPINRRPLGGLIHVAPHGAVCRLRRALFLNRWPRPSSSIRGLVEFLASGPSFPWTSTFKEDAGLIVRSAGLFPTQKKIIGRSAAAGFALMQVLEFRFLDCSSPALTLG